MKTGLRGFTLMELLITLSIAVLLMTIAIPSMQGFIAGARLDAGVTALTSLLQFARARAVELNHSITICPTTGKQQCGEANSWNRGIMVFVDRNSNRRRDIDETLLRYHPMNEQLLVYSGTTPDKTGRSRKRVVFTPSGSAAGHTISIRLCPRNSDIEPRVVIVQNSGRIRVSTTDGSGKRPECQT